MALFQVGKLRLPLHIHIATLFTLLLVICGSALAWFNHAQLSKVILDASTKMFEQVTRETSNDIAATYGTTSSAVELLAYSGLVNAYSREQRLAALPELALVLTKHQRISAVYSGYDNGDIFLLRRLNLSELKAKYNAPTATQYMLTLVEHKNGQRAAYHWFYDLNFIKLGEVTDPNYKLDPRQRPWYKKAIQSKHHIATKAYRFYTSGQLGITLAARSANGNAVIGADYTLNALSANLAKYKITDNSELAIYNDAGEVLAYHIPDKLLQIKEKSRQLHTPEQLDLPVLQYAVAHLSEQQTELSFEFNKQKWLGRVTLFSIEDKFNMHLIILVPEKELLASAYVLRSQSVWVTLGILALTLPIAWYFARLISTPIRQLTNELKHVKSFEFDRTITTRSFIQEIDQLADVSRRMKDTISHFQQLSSSIMGQQSFPTLLKKITTETLALAKAKGGLVYLSEGGNDQLKLTYSYVHGLNDAQGERLLANLQDDPVFSELDRGRFSKGDTILFETLEIDAVPDGLSPLLSNDGVLNFAFLPLYSRSGELIGSLVMKSDKIVNGGEGQIAFIEALAGYAALAIQGQLLLKQQKELLNSFIEIIAGAIDAKSPYTGGHCSRVPELTKMLSKAACDAESGPYKSFQLSSDEWEELHIAAWLHDCGKIVTPDYVVDKATKLETVYDRIHEVRMRFEVLKRDADINYWSGLAKGGDQQVLQRQREQLKTTLDAEFEFVAQCNQGSEFMAQSQLDKLAGIAQRTWSRSLDDRLGISKEEQSRKAQYPAAPLPVQEPLLDNKREHLVPHTDVVKATAVNNPWGFKVQAPEYKFNRGELYNLSIQKGTLTPEERYIINAHMVHTIMMLSKLPMPAQLKNVALIAGSHHEKMDGTGYPKQIKAGELPLTARVMVIADIFEALTAADRPYKKANTLSDALNIMTHMAREQHIDAELFKLFLESGVCQQYAKDYLLSEQRDQVDIHEIIASVELTAKSA